MYCVVKKLLTIMILFLFIIMSKTSECSCIPCQACTDSCANKYNGYCALRCIIRCIRQCCSGGTNCVACCNDTPC